MNKKREFKRLVLSSLGLGALIVGSIVPANSAVPGVTANEIKLGITSPTSGSVGAVYGKIPGAMKAYFEYINANGGVYGRKIKLVHKDDGYIPQKAAEGTRALVNENVFAFVGSLGTANVKRAYSSASLGSKGIPSLFVNTGSSQFADQVKYPTLFTVLPSYTMEAKVLAKYMKEDLKITEFTLVAQADEFGTEAQTGFAAAGLKPSNVVTYGAGSISSPATAKTAILDKLGTIKTVVLFGTTDSTGYLLRALQDASKVGDYNFLVGSVGGDANTLFALKVNPETINGIIAASFFPDAKDSNDEYVKQFSEINAKYNPGISFDNVVLQGMNSAMLTVQALRAAGKNLTREGLIKAIESKGSTFASAGLLPLNFSASSHVGYNGYWLGKLNTLGELKPIGSTKVIYVTDSKTGPVATSQFVRPSIPAKGIPNNS